MGSHDVIVVGCGGWGLAVLKVLKDMGLHAMGIERQEVCHNLEIEAKMHTSEILRSSHFQVWHVDADASRRGEFSAFCSNYHEQDRAGVVPGADDYPYRESYRQVSADDFLEDMDPSFE